jgi:hypothetical protein
MRTLSIAVVGFVALALAAPNAVAQNAAVGTMDLVGGGCPAPDAVAFTFEDNGDGTWSFTVVDIGLATCYWAQIDTLIGVGSPATGFTGDVASGPWTIDGNTFSVSGLTFDFPNGGMGLGGNYEISGDATGVMA